MRAFGGHTWTMPGGRLAGGAVVVDAAVWVVVLVFVADVLDAREWDAVGWVLCDVVVVAAWDVVVAASLLLWPCNARLVAAERREAAEVVVVEDKPLTRPASAAAWANAGFETALRRKTSKRPNNSLFLSIDVPLQHSEFE